MSSYQDKPSCLPDKAGGKVGTNASWVLVGGRGLPGGVPSADSRDLFQPLAQSQQRPGGGCLWAPHTPKPTMPLLRYGEHFRGKRCPETKRSPKAEPLGGVPGLRGP